MSLFLTVNILIYLQIIVVLLRKIGAYLNLLSTLTTTNVICGYNVVSQALLEYFLLGKLFRYTYMIVP